VVNSGLQKPDHHYILISCGLQQARVYGEFPSLYNVKAIHGKHKVPSVIFVDILATRAAYCMKFYKTIGSHAGNQALGEGRHRLVDVFL